MRKVLFQRKAYREEIIPNDEFVNTLTEILNINLNNYKETLDVILVWGTTLKPKNNDKFLDALNKTKKKSKLFCTTIEYTNDKYEDKIRFRHPSLRYDKVVDLKVTSVSEVKKGIKYINIAPPTVVNNNS